MATLRIGDTGEPVKTLPRNLNKLGSLLLVDGDFHTATAQAVVDARGVLNLGTSSDADDGLQQHLATLPEPCAPLTSAGVTFIARAEVSSPAAYRTSYCHPTWPSETSGITIGIGYDLQFCTPQQFQSEWGGRLAQPDATRLLAVIGAVGSRTSLQTVRDLTIPLPVAVGAFISHSVPLYIERTRSIYPSLDNLTAAQRTALVSLVYNRGNRLTDLDPAVQDRREMRAIRDLLASGRLADVPAQFESMTRLWTNAKLSGLVQRRKDEATLWRSGFGGVVLQ
jgi:GH24 family phage-related lysozyme (muramidase)